MGTLTEEREGKPVMLYVNVILKKAGEVKRPR